MTAFSILIADDNEINRLLLLAQLESWAFALHVANDGQQAWEYLHRQRFDLILLDIHMPFFNGFELLTVIKQPQSLNQKTPVVAVTALAQPCDRQKLIDQGFDDCLIKPVLLEDLSRIIECWLTAEPVAVIPATPENNVALTAYSQSVLDKTGGNVSMALMLLEQLFWELPQQLVQIEQALTLGQWVAAAEVVHRLRGSASFLGFNELNELAGEQEMQLRAGNPCAMTTFKQLQQKLDELCAQQAAIMEELAQRL